MAVTPNPDLLPQDEGKQIPAVEFVSPDPAVVLQDTFSKKPLLTQSDFWHCFSRISRGDKGAFSFVCRFCPTEFKAKDKSGIQLRTLVFHLIREHGFRPSQFSDSFFLTFIPSFQRSRDFAT